MYTVEQLTQIGGKYWQGGEKRRVYFNNLYEFAGVEEMEFYGTGSIKRAVRNGEVISNSAARKLSMQLDTMDLWYDLNDGKFYFRSRYPELAREIISKIKARLNGN